MGDYVDDKDCAKEFVKQAKQRGVMGNVMKGLKKLCGLKVKKKDDENEEPVKVPKKKKKELDPKEIENIARDKMEPFMQSNGFWHKDLFLVLFEYQVYKPDDLGSLSKSDRKEIVQAAELKGLMDKVKKFKAYFN